MLLSVVLGYFEVMCTYTVILHYRPQLWFTLRILKGLEITSIPFLHNWLYHYIVDCFTDCKWSCDPTFDLHRVIHSIG